MAPTNKAATGLKLTVEGSILEVHVAFGAITRKGLERGGSLAPSKKSEVSFSEFCAEPLPLSPEEEVLGVAPKTCNTRLRQETKCPNHPRALHEKVMKGYDTGGEQFVYLTEEQVERFKAKGEASVHITPLDMMAPPVPDAMLRLFSGMRYLMPLQLEDEETTTKFEALRAFMGNRVGVARVTWRRSFFYGLVFPAQAGGLFVQTITGTNRAYGVPVVPTGRLTVEQAMAIGEKGNLAAKGRGWNDDLAKENPYTKGLKEAITAVLMGEDVEAVEAPVAPKKKVDILAMV